MPIVKAMEPTSIVACPNGHELGNILYGLKFFGDPEGYCINCGAKMVKKASSIEVYRCSKCNSYVNETWRFCLNCGEKLT